ncbi:MAG: methyltransferase domain-containing protein, partial [Oscillospiraceae bacterium]
NSPAYAKGLYTLQNTSSMLASVVLKPQSGETVIDVCSAPGGKTTHIAELMKNKGKIIAFDVHSHKIRLVENAARRLGIDIIECLENNSENILEKYIGVADKVLADVPCSGLGVIHKKPDIKWRRKPEDIENLVAIQSRILEASSKYLKVGGEMVYSTCTILKEENQEQVEKFLENNSNFEKIEEHMILTHKNGGSGFYICKLKRNE